MITKYYCPLKTGHSLLSYVDLYFKSLSVRRGVGGEANQAARTSRY